MNCEEAINILLNSIREKFIRLIKDRGDKYFDIFNWGDHYSFRNRFIVGIKFNNFIDIAKKR